MHQNCEIDFAILYICTMKCVLPFVIATLLCLTSCLGEVLGEYTKTGRLMPAFEVTTSDGRQVNSASLVGMPCVIVFFNTHCTDCQEELPKLQAVYEKYKTNVRFVCISRSEGEDEIAPFWRSHALTMPYSAQTDKRVFNLFAATRIPRVYVTDKNGKVRKVFVEKVNKRKLNNAILSLCNEK